MNRSAVVAMSWLLLGAACTGTAAPPVPTSSANGRDATEAPAPRSSASGTRLVIDPSEVVLSDDDVGEVSDFRAPFAYNQDDEEANDTNCPEWSVITRIEGLPQTFTFWSVANLTVAVVEREVDDTALLAELAALPAACPTFDNDRAAGPDGSQTVLRPAQSDAEGVVILDVVGEGRRRKVTAYGARLNILWSLSRRIDDIDDRQSVETSEQFQSFLELVAVTEVRVSQAPTQETLSEANAALYLPGEDDIEADPRQLSFVSALLVDDPAALSGWRQSFIFPYRLGFDAERPCDAGDGYERDWTGYTLMYLHEDDVEIANDDNFDNLASQTVGVGPTDGSVSRHIANVRNGTVCGESTNWTVLGSGPIAEFSDGALTGIYIHYRDDDREVVYAAVDLGRGVFTQIYRPLREGESFHDVSNWIAAVEQRLPALDAAWKGCDVRLRNWSPVPADLVDLPHLDECSGITTFPYLS